MAHTLRAEDAWTLRQATDADLVVIDDGSMGETQCGDTTWEDLSDLNTDWSVVLQDDAVLVDGFRPALDAALDVAGDALVGLYVGTCRPRSWEVQYAVEVADAMDASWLTSSLMLWGVGIAMPTRLIPEFLTWGRSRQAGTDARYDRRLGWFARRIGLPIKYTWPSLVDHADGPSLVAKPRPQRIQPCSRVARRVGVRESYDGPAVEIPRRAEDVPVIHLPQSL